MKPTYLPNVRVVVVMIKYYNLYQFILTHKLSSIILMKKKREKVLWRGKKHGSSAGIETREKNEVEERGERPCKYTHTAQRIVSILFYHLLACVLLLLLGCRRLHLYCNYNLLPMFPYIYQKFRNFCFTKAKKIYSTNHLQEAANT